MGAFNQLNGAIFDAAAIEARISAVDGKSIYNQRDGGILDFDSLARRLTALDGKVAVGQGGIEFDVDTFMRRLAAIEAGVFTPASLGAVSWFDTGDFSVEFQDSAGTTPVTAVTNPVGLFLDKGLGLALGANICTDSGFDNPGAWSAGTGAVVGGGKLTLTAVGPGVGVSQLVTTVGKYYEVTVTIDSISLGAVVINMGNNSVTMTTVGTFTRRVLAANGALSIVGSGASTTAVLDNCTCREVTGNHMSQATGGSRPLVQTQGGILTTKSDGLDDFLASVVGGGGTAGFFYCAAINPSALGANQTLWADTGTNTGYRVRLNASNQLELAAGNGVAFTTAATVAAVTSGTTFVVTAWHDGVNLNVQINSGTVGTTSFGTTTAGTASFTEAASNGGASGFFNGYLFNRIYKKDSALTSVQRAQVQQYVAAGAGVSL